MTILANEKMYFEFKGEEQTRRIYKVKNYNTRNGQYELLAGEFHSRKKAQEMADWLNEPDEIHNATVVYVGLK